MQIWVFDQNIERVAYIDRYFSLRWRRRYRSVGEFELHCPATYVEAITEGNYIWKGDEEAGVIETVILEVDTEGNETLTVAGRFLGAELETRILWGYFNWAGTYEGAMRELVQRHAINRKPIPFLELAPTKGFTDTLDYQTSYAADSSILTEVEALSAASDIGWRVEFDPRTKTKLFATYQGLDRRAGQTINPPVVFSRERNNVNSQTLTKSTRGYYNVALVAGEGEGKNRKTVTVGDTASTGLARREMFVDARDLQKEVTNTAADGTTTTTTLTNAQYLDTLRARGYEKLAEQALTESFEPSVQATGSLTYREDYDIGDLVTVAYKRWGVRLDARILEAEEVYEESEQTIYLTVGEPAETAGVSGVTASETLTADDVLAKLKSVDGSGSGLDADTLDGKHDGQVSAGYLKGSGFYVGSVVYDVPAFNANQQYGITIPIPSGHLSGAPQIGFVGLTDPSDTQMTVQFHSGNAANSATQVRLLLRSTVAVSAGPRRFSVFLVG